MNNDFTYTSFTEFYALAGLLSRKSYSASTDVVKTSIDNGFQYRLKTDGEILVNLPDEYMYSLDRDSGLLKLNPTNITDNTFDSTIDLDLSNNDLTISIPRSILGKNQATLFIDQAENYIKTRLKDFNAEKTPELNRIATWLSVGYYKASVYVFDAPIENPNVKTILDKAEQWLNDEINRQSLLPATSQQ